MNRGPLELIYVVLQVLQLSYQATDKSIELSTSSRTDLEQDVALDKIAEDLRSTNKDLENKIKEAVFGNNVAEKHDLIDLSRKGQQISEELLRRLHTYRVTHDNKIDSAFTNLQQDKEKLHKAKGRLDNLQKRTDGIALVHLRDKVERLERTHKELHQKVDWQKSEIHNLAALIPDKIIEQSEYHMQRIINEINSLKELVGIAGPIAASVTEPHIPSLGAASQSSRIASEELERRNEIFQAAATGNKPKIREILREFPSALNLVDQTTGRTPLHMACAGGHRACADYLLQNLAKVTADDNEGMTALHFAVQNNDGPLVRALRRSGADVNFRNDADKTPMDYSKINTEVRFVLLYGPKLNARDERQLDAINHFAEKGNNEAVRSLLRQNALPDSLREDGTTPLWHAVWRERVDVIETLVETGANMEHRDGDGRTPLLFAALWGLTKSVKVLLKHGADIHAVNRFGWTALQDACRHAADRNSDGKHLEVARMLIDAGSDLHRRDGDLYMPLNRAALDGVLPVVQLLLEHGADPNVKGAPGAPDDQWMALHEAAEYGRPKMIKLLLDHGADPNAVQGGKKYRPIHMAAKQNRPDCVKMLIDHGNADFQVGNADGWTALHEAAYYNHVTVAKVLLNREADPSARNKNGGVPALLAARHGHVDILKLLAEYHADLQLANRQGMCPIIEASSNGHLDAVRFLIEQGVDVNVRNNEGYSPLNYAAMHGHPPVVGLLLDAGKADIEGRNNGGWSSLMEAAHHGRMYVLNDLIARGAILDHRDFKGRDAIVLAGEHGHKEAQEVIRAAIERRRDQAAKDGRDAQATKNSK